ncbi:DedA family protein [Haloarchaeobius sp. HME9146]|uniref:DedA family protein n=1 Tax=Haloarchaeobius sp. HME9146 TaxID=2978732 RepID=UPI0021C190F2|nr:VTT domain-containing protein [Haloarchaeobius sp. HME9146]MCT9094746.1 VTT domain-containing protein [Haloarchaeobius sp. HME9146]
MTVAATLPLPLVVLAALLPLGVASVFSEDVRDSTRRLALDYGVFVLFGFFAVVGVWLFLNRDAAFFEVLLERYWLAALFAIFILEGAMLLYFAPSESLVPVAIGLAIETDIAPNTLPVYALIIGTAVAGATIGQYVLFLLAKRWGRERLLERPWFRISDSQLERFEDWFGKWGLLAVPVSNTLLFTRGMLTVPAGLSEMDDHQFILLSALGTLSFEIVLALVTMGVLELGFL